MTFFAVFSLFFLHSDLVANGKHEKTTDWGSIRSWKKTFFLIFFKVESLALVSTTHRAHVKNPVESARIFKSYSLANSNQTELCTSKEHEKKKILKFHIVGKKVMKWSSVRKSSWMCSEFSRHELLALSCLSQTFPSASFPEVFLSLSLSSLSVDIDGNVRVLRRKTLWTFQS